MTASRIFLLYLVSSEQTEIMCLVKYRITHTKKKIMKRNIFLTMAKLNHTLLRGMCPVSPVYLVESKSCV